jgi:hypothetical protein
MASVSCPNCGLVNPEGAEACDCGWDFSHAQLPHRMTAGRTGAQKYRLVYGSLLIVIGVVWIVSGLLRGSIRSSVPFGCVAIGLYALWRGSQDESR